ncbi:MAG: hypothetical protein HDR13_01715 [Lachnospiraceae bacterium]|nr:hypothetical protein [Lachnospiraceae bacterium]
MLCHEKGGYLATITSHEDYAKEWKSENPDMAEDGLYYFRYIGGERKNFCAILTVIIGKRGGRYGNGRL